MDRKLASHVIVLFLFACAALPASADDWPTYRHDERRSGVSTERIQTPLSLQWVHTPTHPPSHAWSAPRPEPVEGLLELPRLQFDDAFHVAAVGESVYFGSSADGKVYALDAKSGRVRWQFHTDGPVRLAPTVWRGKVYVGSDDGTAYCLGADDGKLIWKFRAAPSDRMALGNGRMISLWPVRTGVTVVDGVAYFGAGVFPAEGLYLYAVAAEDGKLIWKNDTYGLGGRSGISPQGYLLASKDKLFVPSGRATPAAFHRASGDLLFHRSFIWRVVGMFGGTNCVLADGIVLNGGEQLTGVRGKNGELAFTEGVPASVHSTGIRRMVVRSDALCILTGAEAIARTRKWILCQEQATAMSNELIALRKKANMIRRAAKSDPQAAKGLAEIRNRFRQAAAEKKMFLSLVAKTKKWNVPCDANDSLVSAANVLLAGGKGKVIALNPDSGKKVWSAKVDGRARGLAIANGRLLVSTDTGAIHCFAPGRRGKDQNVSPKIDASPFPRDKLAAFHERTAEKIVNDSGVKRGFALILGGEGRLALELARRTDLRVYMVQPDAKKLTRAREALTAAGVCGTKVTVMQRPLDALPFADFFANLVVCEDGFFVSSVATPPDEVLRVLKPCGGVAFIGQPAGAGEFLQHSKPMDLDGWLDGLRNELDRLGEKGTKAAAEGKWAKIVRGPLPGAGAWTHQYGEPGNTACSDDRRVRGSLGILWYGDPGPGEMPGRHASNVAPLGIGGRMFVQGEEVVMAYDAYNGLELWKRRMPGALRLRMKTNVSNFAADADSLYVVIGEQCHRLDAATGTTLKTYDAPAFKGAGEQDVWQYVARAGDLLFGSRGSRGVFALDVRTGKTRWTHAGGDIMPTTICIGDGRVFFVDRTVTDKQKATALKNVPKTSRLDRLGEPVPPDVRLVVALNAATGKIEWTRPQYLSDCVVKVTRGAGELTAMYANNVLLLCGQPWNGHFWKQFDAGEFSRRSLIALAAYDGREMWSGRKGYRSRPLIVGSEIIAEPWAYDLATGKAKQRTNPLTGTQSKWQISRPGHHCGNIAGAPNALFFRSGATANYDMLGDYGTAHFGAQRPGCWINCIPANGVVMMPEASSGCVCPFSLHCTIVFAPRKTNRVWGVYSAEGPTLPVERLAINFGAPGDRKDASGALWLAHPRLRSDRLVLDPLIETEPVEGTSVLKRNPDFLKIEGTSEPWIFAYGYQGLSRCAVPLTEPEGETRTYTVRLYFAEVRHDGPEKRVFDVALGGKTVLKGFDIAQAAGGAGRAVVKEFKHVRVQGSLEVTLRATRGQTLLCGLEIIAEKKP